MAQIENGLFVANADPSRLGKNPFIAVTANDNGDSVGKLVTRESFLTALAIPELREKIISNLWNKSLLRMPYIDPDDEAIKIAVNASSSGVAVTTVLTGSKEKDDVIHIFHAPATEKASETVIVASGDLDKRLRALLKSSGVTYVDYHDMDAIDTVNKAVEKSLNNNIEKDKLKAHLSAAFLMRNGVAGEEASHADKTLGELMTSMRSLQPSAPLRITKRPVKSAKPKL